MGISFIKCVKLIVEERSHLGHSFIAWLQIFATYNLNDHHALTSNTHLTGNGFGSQGVDISEVLKVTYSLSNGLSQSHLDRQGAKGFYSRTASSGKALMRDDVDVSHNCGWLLADTFRCDILSIH